MRMARRKEKGKKEDRAKARAEEKERETSNLSSWSSTRMSADTEPILVSNLPREDFSALGDEEARDPSPAAQSAVSGAWGARSFASALHSPSPGRPGLDSQRPARSQQHIEDEWDIDVAWHELEQRSGGGGRRKRANKLVVLGSGGGGARRR